MKDLLTELEQTKAAILTLVSAISQDDFNKPPFEGSWTPAQVCDHVLKSTGEGIFYGNTAATNRAPDEKVKATADIFLNFETKLKSPDFILPANEPLNKHVVLSELETRFDKLIAVAETMDLSPICLDFEIPVLGPYTRLEFLWFYIFHTQRHIYQISNMVKVPA